MATRDTHDKNRGDKIKSIKIIASVHNLSQKNNQTLFPIQAD